MQSARQLLAGAPKLRRRRRESTPEPDVEVATVPSDNEEDQDEERVDFLVGQNQKGGPVIWFDGFRFVKKLSRKGTMYWMCEEFGSKRCPVKARTTAGDYSKGIITPTSDSGAHNHLPKPRGQEVLLFGVIFCCYFFLISVKIFFYSG
jgi:hypothetical protein